MLKTITNPNTVQVLKFAANDPWLHVLIFACLII